MDPSAFAAANQVLFSAEFVDCSSFLGVARDVGDAEGVALEPGPVGAACQAGRSSSVDAVVLLAGVVAVMVVVAAVDMGIDRKTFGVVGNTFRCAFEAAGNTS